MDNFLSIDKCQRCGGGLSARIMSWFTDETLCLTCSGAEDELKKQLRENGVDPSALEGCGYIPKV